MKTILILGSSGQIGSHLTKFLNEKNLKVLEFDIENSPEEDLRIKNNEKLIDMIKKSDFIFFLAFDVGGSKYLSKYQYSFDFLNNNILIMENIFNLIKIYERPFIFASTQMSNMSHSPYGTLKLLGEFLAKSLNGLTLRFWNVYGIENNLDKSHVITDFILKALKEKRIDMLTDGEEERQFLHADDCCDVMYMIMNSYEDFLFKNKIDITSFESIKIKEIANIISKKLDNVIIIPSKNTDLVQLNMKNIPDNFILKFWSPKINIENGIEKIIEYYKKNSLDINN